MAVVWNPVSKSRRSAVAFALVATWAAPSHAQIERVFERSGAGERSRYGRVQYLGDLDDDGFDEFAVGSPNLDVDLDGDGRISAGERSVGIVELYSGRHPGEPLRTWSGEATDDQFGTCIARVGDLNRDGVADFAVGVPNQDHVARRAWVRLYSGNLLRRPDLPEVIADLEDLNDRDFNGVPDGWQGDFGSSIAAIGDVSNDGVPDLLVAGNGVYRWAVVFSGRTREVIWTWDVHPVGGRDRAVPTAVAGFERDVTGDGKLDVVVGNFASSSSAGAEAGAVWIYSGLTTTPFRTIRGVEHHDWLGCDVLVVPDVSGDAAALPELVIGASGTFTNGYGPDENGNYLLTLLGEDLGGAPRELRGETLGLAPGAFFGAILESGDVRAEASGPARHELLVAARHHDEQRGRVCCLEFDPVANDWAPLWSIDGKEAGDKIGRLSARGRLTADPLDPTRPDAGDDLLLGTGHVDSDGLEDNGRIWCLSADAGAKAEIAYSGEAWADDGCDPALLPEIEVALLPLLGTTVTVELRCRLDPQAWGLLLIGTSDAVRPDTPHLLIDDFVSSPFQLLGGTASVTVEIPIDPACFAAGTRYYAQALLAFPDVEGGVGYTCRVDATLGSATW